MVNARIPRSVVATSLLCILGATSRIAAQEKPPPPGQTDAAKQGASPSKPVTPRVRQAIFQAYVLRQMTERKLDLSASQKENVARLFDDSVAEIKRAAPGPDAPLAPLIEGDWGETEAGPASDTDSRTVLVDETVAQFVKNIKEQLQPGQATGFYRVLGLWAKVCPPGPRMGPLQPLRSAVSHPEMDLSPEQQTAVGKILNDAFKEVRSARASPEKVDDVACKTEIAVFEKLTPEQQTKVEAHVRLLKEASEFVLGPSRGDQSKKERATDEKEKSADDK